MAQAGYTPIQLYHSTTAGNTPSSANLVNGELSINITDGRLFYKDNSGNVQVLATKAATAGEFAGSSAAGATIKLYEDTDNGTNYVAFKAPDAIGSDVTWTLPSADGTNNQVLATNGSGTLSWVDQTGGGGGGGGGGVSTTTTQFTASGGQTTFSVSYTVGQIGVYMNGALLASADYTASNGTSVVLAAGATAGDIVTVVAYATVSQIKAGDSNVTVTDTGSGQITFTTDNNERMRVTSSGQVLIGATTARSNFFNTTTVVPRFQVEFAASDNLNRFISVTSNNSDTGGGTLILAKSRGTTVGAVTIVQNDDQIGSVSFQAADGVDMVEAARIEAKVDGTPGSNDMPTSLRFYTTADGAASPSERMRIDSSGNLLVGTTSQLATNLRNTITRQQLPVSNSTAWADQMSPLVVYGNFGDGSNDQGVSSALTLVGWSSLAGNVGAIMRGWWSQTGAGLSTPTLKIQIAHTGNVTNLNNSYGSLSDARLKENITDATPKLENLNKLRVVNFNLKADPDKQKQIGLIAQEVEEVFPGLVETDGEGNKSVKYSVLVPMLLKAVQEQQAVIEQLKADVAALKGQA
jgi:hypothetical protein